MMLFMLPELSTTSMTFGVTPAAMNSGIWAIDTALPAWLMVSRKAARNVDIPVRRELRISCLQWLILGRLSA